MRDRFLREARSTASLRHPHVAEVFQLGTSPETGQAYYAMELIEGETLEERVCRDGPLPEIVALEVAAQVARALVAAAAQGLVHRDLKPANLMLSHDHPLGPLHVIVIDFGLAHAAAYMEKPYRLNHGGFVGTPAFASPEQLQGMPTDARSDIYSLGVTLWYTLTGRFPFDGNTAEALRDHPNRSVLPLAQLRQRKVSAPLAALLRSSLATDPAARPASARDFLTALEACRRRRSGLRLAAALGATAVLLVAGIAWWTHGRNRPIFAAGPAAAMDKSVAVLPFDNFSEGTDNAFFADGVQDTVLTDLAKLADLKVISRSSVMHYRDARRRDLREIGRALGVAYVVEGSVQRAGSKIRVTAQLIDTRTDTHVWAEQYDRDATDVFALQTEIARTIAGQLRTVISPQEQAAMTEVPTRNEQAYQLYLRAVARWQTTHDPENDIHCYEALNLLRQATALDPGFARAYALMAELGAEIYIHTVVPADGEAVRAYAETAARLRPG